MPGTIRVSVLDLMDIPSSASSSPVSIKGMLPSSFPELQSAATPTVAMGKREFQTCDKGDFLFPLTTLRDNLIVTLCDAEGNEISRTDVATMSVVQKGLWDDLFPLEGGGLIHMKLQFILSEEDHKRIQDMREAAVKKKQGELGKRSVDHSETPTDVAAGDLQESAVPMKAIGVSEEPTKGSNLETIEHIEDIQSSSDVQHNRPKQTAPDGSGNSSTDPLSQEVQKDSEHPSECISSHLTEANYITSEETQSSNIQSTSTDVTQRPIWSHEALDPSLRCSESSRAEFITENRNSVSSTSGEDRTPGSEMESSIKRNPSSVRKMITAFESTLTKELKSRVGPLEKPQRSKIKMESSSKRPWVLEEASAISIFTGRLPDANLQQNPKYLKPLHAKKLEETPHSNLDTGSGRKDPFGLKNEQLELLGVRHDLVEETNSDKDTRESNRCLGINDGGLKTCREDSDDQSISGASKGKQELVIDNEVRQCLFESPWSWIFQDETRRLCITTGSKQMRNVVEGYSIYTETQKQPGVVNFSRTEEESMICDNTHTEVNKDDAASCKLRKPKLDNSADISKIAWGLIEQVKVNGWQWLEVGNYEARAVAMRLNTIYKSFNGPKPGTLRISCWRYGGFIQHARTVIAGSATPNSPCSVEIEVDMSLEIFNGGDSYLAIAVLVHVLHTQNSDSS